MQCARSPTEVPLFGIDVVEVSPPFDHADITALLGNRVVLEALSGMAKRASGEPWDPSTAAPGWQVMRVLAIGAGGVGTSAALIAKRRDFFEAWVIADYDDTARSRT